MKIPIQNDFAQYERKFRMKIFYAVTPLILTLITYFSVDPLQTMFRYYNVKVLGSIVIAILVSFSLLLFLMLYLQTGFKRPRLLPIHETVGSTQELTLMKEELFNLRTEIERMYKKQALKETTDISPEQRADLINILAEKIKSESSQNAIEEIEQKFKGKYEEKQKMKNIYSYYDQIRARLSTEVSGLNRRSNLNLVLGILITIAGIFLLYTFVYNSEMNKTEIVPFLFFFIPKLALVIFIETFAYFFLTLYKASLTEIKHYQKEMTDIETQKIALFTSLELGREDTISNVLNGIMSQHGSLQTSETSKFDINLTSTIRDVLTSIVDKKIDELKNEKLS